MQELGGIEENQGESLAVKQHIWPYNHLRNWPTVLRISLPF